MVHSQMVQSEGSVVHFEHNLSMALRGYIDKRETQERDQIKKE